MSLRLEVNHWNGATEPRVVLGTLYAAGTPAADAEARRAQGPAGELDDGEWWHRFEAELARPLEQPSQPSQAATPRARETIDRRGASGLAAVASLASAGGPLLVLACDALRRRALVELAAPPARFGGGGVAIASARLPARETAAAVAAIRDAGSGIVLADWTALNATPRLPGGFEHVLAIDPPSSSGLEALAAAGRSDAPGFLHLAWGPEEVALTSRVYESEWPSRPVLGAVFRALRSVAESGPMAAAPARLALGGPGPFPRSPEAAARCVRILTELGLVQLDGEPGERVLGVVSSEATELERSMAFAAYRRLCEEGIRFLTERGQAA